ncbi:MAG: AbrB/MazE/SpoVT family DNA-binding domain-containing protein [Dehalococcoidia bacterium]|nr:AbrB/MazE/SpoVT family DNA-binding domain-containing protein [Dehalococcoidia bacterium]
MPGLERKTIIRLGKGSFVVALPKSWCRYYKLQPGDKVIVVANGEVKITPVGDACE